MMCKMQLYRNTEQEWRYGCLAGSGGTLNGSGLERARDGSYYYGSWNNGMRDGIGTLAEPGGGLVIAMWEQDRAAKSYVKVWPQGSGLAVFWGEIDRGKPKDGILLKSDGKLYEGIYTSWQGEEFDGEGAFTWPDGREYAGRWKNGGPDAGGVMRRNTGKVTGTLSNVRSGYTTQAWPQGSDKEFFYGKTDDAEIRNARGMLFYAGGEFYCGEIKAGLKTGTGAYRDADGSIRVGSWEDGEQRGFGIRIKWSKSLVECYVGEFLDGVYDGTGCVLTRTQSGWDYGYVGTWKSGQKSGEGMSNLGSGQAYVGGFASGVYDGRGETVQPDGTRSAMDWKMGVPDVKLEEVRDYGPTRSAYRSGDSIPAGTLNCVGDDSLYGDERTFVGIRNDENAGYERSMRIEPGCDYEVRVCFHNDSMEGNIDDAVLRAYYPSEVQAGSPVAIAASIASGAASPLIWDGVTLIATKTLSLKYKMASAKLTNGTISQGRVLPQSLFTAEGTMIGTQALDGHIDAGQGGIVTFVVRTSGTRNEGSRSFAPKRPVPVSTGAASMPVEALVQPAVVHTQEPSLQQQGRHARHSRVSIKALIKGTVGDYGKTATLDAGETADICLRFTNSASAQDMKITVALPDALEYVPGSGVIELTDGSAHKLGDGWILGYTLEQFASCGEGEINFKTRFFPFVAEEHKGVATIETEDISMQSTFTVSQK